MVATTRNTPQQLNGFDCGVFASYCAHYISLGVRPTFSQADMPHLRRRMMADILAKKIHASEMQFATIPLQPAPAVGCGRLRPTDRLWPAAAGCGRLRPACELVADVDLEVDARYKLVAAVDLEVDARYELVAAVDLEVDAPPA
ncbi:hypothetical protein M885DRAFT_581039 [Pelagophyceae sp. CCMP2097]|nr:hypothetical protein M885DRAFT_581039 [Pelagophyceae sp. CCMP2097]